MRNANAFIINCQGESARAGPAKQPAAYSLQPTAIKKTHSRQSTVYSLRKKEVDRKDLLAVGYVCSKLLKTSKRRTKRVNSK
jgi:hypothetical protein